MTSDESWFAAHIYYAPPWEPLLLDALWPTALALTAEGAASSFFFIRYGERGPHIRLRFKAPTTHHLTLIKPRIQTEVAAWLRQNPSNPDTYPEAPDGAPPNFPINSIQYLPYHPETSRYGGPVGLPLAEALFEASSRAALHVMSESESWGYDEALGAAVTMHLALTHSLGLRGADLIQFFQMVAKVWLPGALNPDQLTSPEAEAAAHTQLLNLFGQAFEQQKVGLIPFCDQLLSMLEEGAATDCDWLDRWIADTQTFAGALAQSGMQIQPPPRWQGPRERRLWPLFESCIHMTNNRLGVGNRDEAFLGYLIANSLSVK